MDLITFVQLLFRVLYALLIIRIILSWIPGVNFYHPAVHFVYRVTSPILDPIRRVVPSAGGLDLSPLVAFLLLNLVQRVVIDLMIRALNL